MTESDTTDFDIYSSDDDDLDIRYADSSDDNDEQMLPLQHQQQRVETTTDSRPKNIAKMLFNRERSGYVSGSSRNGQRQMPLFKKVPNYLTFCLIDILPKNIEEGHIFMGLTGCGQFMISYRAYCSENIIFSHYFFNVGFKYALYLWIFQPHKPLRLHSKRCLFDDHGVDHIKKVTMTQWKNGDTRVLIVHGAPVEENEDSYITYVKVPRLGCLECKKLYEKDDSAPSFYNTLCLNCNLTVHTKYSQTDTDPKFEPTVNLLCPDRMIIVANGFLHMLRIEIDTPAITSASYLSQDLAVVPNTFQLSAHNATTAQQVDEKGLIVTPTMAELESGVNIYQNSQNVAARIIADFSDFETDNRINEAMTTPTKNTKDMTLKHNHSDSSEYSFNNMDIAHSSNNSSPKSSPNSSSGASLISNKRKRHERIVTKSFRNGMLNVDVQVPATSSSSNATAGAITDKSNAYEFSEDNEKCEKISTLRKRRLADKKYEFSEDNTENIIPFIKLRSAGKKQSLAAQLYSVGPGSSHASNARSMLRFSPTTHYFHANSPCASPSSSPHPAQQQPTSSNYTSPPHMGFRSPPSCASPASTSVMRSPSRYTSNVSQMYNQKSPTPLSPATLHMLSYKPLGALSPLQVSLTKRSELSGSMSPNTNYAYMSPRRDEQRIIEVPLQGDSMAEKPICTKKLKRRYVEEDDALSVITSEEDDCISPGYHTSLPMEVHGACYSELQMVSQASYQRLRCNSVVITQHSFDLEAFTYYVITALCQKNDKHYDVFYDWAYDIIYVCPQTQTVTCLLMAQFAAREQLPTTNTNCLNCSGKYDCAFHRHQFECRVLFTWNIESGEWQILDYGELKEVHDISPSKRIGKMQLTFGQQAKKISAEIISNLDKLPDYTQNLRVHNSDVSKPIRAIKDMDNMIELRLRLRGNRYNSN